jgi:tripartite ATP-independent transporter DctP family solute receptor
MKNGKLILALMLVLAVLMPVQVFAQKAIVLRLAETHPKGYPTELGDEEFARLVKERSGGRIIIEVYPGSQLGQEKAVIEQVQFGAIDITRVSVSPVAAFVPRLNAFQMPYLYRDADHMWKVLNGDIGKNLLASLEPFGFIGLGWFEGGSRNFYNSKRPVKTPADLKGLKVRVQESELMMGLVSAFGAIPTPMAYGEVYSALQTGVVDGAENNWASYFSTSHYEVAKYFTLDEHTRVPEIIIGSKISLGRLSKADQELIKKAAADAVDFQRAEWAKYEQISIDKVKAGGAQITNVTDKAPWVVLMAPLYAKQSKEIQDFVKQIQAVK